MFVHCKLCKINKLFDISITEVPSSTKVSSVDEWLILCER